MAGIRDREGYLEIDHRESPGISRELAAKVGRGTIPVEAGKRLQAATLHCVFCESMLIRNPDRERPRAYCPKYDAYMCDRCDLLRKNGHDLKPAKQVLDEVMTALALGKRPDFTGSAFQFLQR